MSLTFPGIIPAVVVPFTRDDSVDIAALRDNVIHVVEGGVHGIVVNGTMGEASSLTLDERALVLATVVEAVGERVPVIAGVSAPSTAQAVAYARQAAEGGARGVMCLPPLNYRGTDAELTAHFAAVAAAGLPVMAYNNPEASGVDMQPATIAAIGDSVEGVVAVKECSADARRIAELLRVSELEILVGGDNWALEGFAAGATGWVSGVANVTPELCVELMNHVQAGRLDQAREINARMRPLADLDMTPWLVQYFKGAMDAFGLKGGTSRAPRLPLNDEQRATLRAALDAIREPAVA